MRHKGGRTRRSPTPLELRSALAAGMLTGDAGVSHPVSLRGLYRSRRASLTWTGEDHAVVHATFQGTGSGEFIGHGVNGAEVRASEMTLFAMADGQIREYTYEWDELGFWAQLGIIDVSPIEP